MRGKLNHRSDARFFRRTAIKTKKKNVEPYGFRGGIRQ